MYKDIDKDIRMNVKINNFSAAQIYDYLKDRKAHTFTQWERMKIQLVIATRKKKNLKERKNKKKKKRKKEEDNDK